MLLDDMINDGEYVYFVNRSATSVVESRLSAEEKRLFDEAKDKSLNRAWEAVPNTVPKGG